MTISEYDKEPCIKVDGLNDLLVAQIGTQPMLTASPAGYPLMKTAEIIANKLR